MGLFSKDEPAPVRLKSGKDLACVVCGCDRFDEREALLNTPGMTFRNLDWANATAQCRVCADCGYVHWFLVGS